MILALIPHAWGGTQYKILHNFGSGSDGSLPSGPLLSGGTGNLYGVTANGGGSGCGGAGCGTVFELAEQTDGKWKELILHRFTDGSDEAIPEGNLVSDVQGNLYGWVKGGYVGQTAVFELTPGSHGWNLDLIWTNGSSPGLLLDQEGNLYGVMGYHDGPIAELSPGPDGWTYTEISDETTSAAPLSWDSKGNLYGTDPSGGDQRCSGGCGTAFQMTPNSDGTWTYHVLHRFGSFKNDGILPVAGLVLDAAGNAYGATVAGGEYNCGNIFKLGLSDGRWKEAVVHQFRGPEGCAPLFTLALGTAGALYGMAQGGDKNCGPCGLIFKLAPQKGGKWEYSILHTFHGPEGADPYGVILDSKGNIFGATGDGGKYNLGVAFEITP